MDGICGRTVPSLPPSSGFMGSSILIALGINMRAYFGLDGNEFHQIIL